MSVPTPTSRRVLVTGAGGFIGRQCLPLLVERGYEVHALSRRQREARADGVHWHRLDLLRGDADGVCARVQPKALLHLAWDTTPGVYTRTPENLDWVAASLRLARSAVEHGATRLVGAGTCFEYWHGGHDACHERTTPLRPDTLYGASKVALGGLLDAYAAEVGVSNAWGRVFFLYGPHEHAGRLVASVIRALLAGETAACSVGTQARDFLHVRDVAASFVALLGSDVQGPVNIGSGEAITVRALVLEIGRQLGRPDLIALGARPLAPGDPPLVVADVARLRDEVGFHPNVDWRDGIRDTIAWWGDHLRPSTYLESESR